MGTLSKKMELLPLLCYAKCLAKWVSERFKRNEYAGSYANPWFWRTQAQQEVDYIEEQDGHLSAFEFKWNPSAKVKQPKAFQTAYPNSSFTVIHKENFPDFLLFMKLS